MKTFGAWAIHTRSEEGHGFVGRFYFRNSPAPEHRGCLTALFETRREAREYLKRVRCDYGFPRAAVVRVKVQIEESA